MKKIAIIILSIASLFNTNSYGNEPICVMSYNIHHGAPLKGERDAARNAAIINRFMPDIVAVQEVDSMTTRCPDNFLADMAYQTGMIPVFCSSMDYASGRYGNGMLCREQPLNVSRYPLPGREEPRSILVAEFDNYIAACTHLSLNIDDRTASIEIIGDISEQSPKPFFIIGDFNDTPDSDFYKLMSERFTAVNDTASYTFPADIPDRTIDYIMLDNAHFASATISHREVIEEPEVSDHRPLVVTLTIANTPETKE